MKCWEAIKALTEGKAIGQFNHKSTFALDKDLMTIEKNDSKSRFTQEVLLSLSCLDVLSDEWEIVDKEGATTTDKTNNDVLDATRETFDEIRDLVIAKSQNYGVGTVFQPPRFVPEATAETGILTRLSDKICRLETLSKGERDKVGESIDDTLKDVVGYCCLLLTFRKLNKESV